MQIIIKQHNNPHSADIINVPDNVNASRIVEAWQKKQSCYLIRKQLPGITWKIAESDNFIHAMIESTKL